MRFAVEAWSPEYGAPVDQAVLGPADTPVDLAPEHPAERWAPLSPPVGTPVPDAVLFVDGVRRVEARVWVTGDDGRVAQGICASYAAGAVRCDGAARVITAEVRRGLFCPAAGAREIGTAHGAFPVRPVGSADAGDDPEQLSLCLQQKMGELELRVTEVAVSTGAADLVVVDGPLRERQHVANAVGYVKTHHKAYLPPLVGEVVGRLAPGQRTPLFVLGGRSTRWSWYARLPGSVDHPWAGVVRGEASADLGLEEVVQLADRATATLPRFASVPQKEPRAPQNLTPIAGLERELRRRLGDPALLYRALRRAASATAPAA